MAVRVSLARGTDLEYLPAAAGKAGQQRQAGSYYISASAEGGEPPGRWWGKGAEALGFAAGQEVERDNYDLVFGERVSPADGTKLGRKPGKRGEVERLVHELRQSMPHATAEELHKIRVHAAQQAKAGPEYIDMASEVSKSVSLFHASLADNVRLATERGDRRAAGYWAGQLEALDEAFYAAVDAGFTYFAREAGYVRTGTGHRVHGKDTGAWREADLAVVHWLQHTSRDEDPHLHMHGQILHAARTQLDGKWRAPDSIHYGEFIGAAGAIISAHLEASMSRLFGVEWTPRADGLGREIKGVSQADMDLFSSRRETITRKVRAWAQKYEAEHGRKPTQRMLQAAARGAGAATRKGKGEGKLDLRQMLATWSARRIGAGRAELAQIAREVSALDGNWQAQADDAQPTEAQIDRCVRQALELVQADKPTWTRADLIRALGLVSPPSVQQMEPEAAAVLLEDLASQALAPAFGAVCLESPDLREVPARLTRADGRSVYQRHGGTRYALASHLASEAQLVESAQAGGAPSMAREDCAQALGAQVAQLDAALAQRAQDAGDRATGSGLRLDQAAALYAALASDRLVEIVTGPAGSGKTRTLAEAARIWNGDVIGITPSSSSREVLAEASGAQCYNSAQFLGHLREGRGMLGAYDIAPGTLILLDEASMMSQADLADILAWARAHGAKVLLSGDQEQLTAVEGGGTMALLAGRLGFGQLLVPVRFAAEWEQDASLRLRAGDASVLTAYDARGRITGGDAERMLDEAAGQYVARYLGGADVLMMARSHEDCRELGRRVQDDLRHLGMVDGGRTVAIGGRARAGAGDLLRVTGNDTMVTEPGRTLLNGDTLLVEQVNADGSLQVRRAIGADRDTGQRRYSRHAFTLHPPQAAAAELAYAVTTHSAQGRTVAYGLAFIRGNEDREWTYVALSRAALSNVALAVTSERKANPSDIARPAPELSRHDRIEAERAGLADPAQLPDATVAALGVLAGNLERQGRPLAALDYQRQELSDADHLAVLRTVVENETAAARADRYAGIFREALEADGSVPYVPAGHADRWLWRTLESAELAGLDPRGLVDRALAQGPLTGARDVVKVLTARVRQLAGPMVPQPGGSWASQVPPLADPQVDSYIRGLAGDMDDRAERLGPFTADAAPAWAVTALGPVPDDPVKRLEWERRAAPVAAYREAYSWDDGADAIGPEPAPVNPQQRARWHEALAALGPVDGVDVRGMTPGALLNARAVYERETAWAPRYVADELRQVRRGGDDSQLRAVRADAEAEAARAERDHERAQRHEALAASHRAAEAFYRQHAEELGEQMAVRQQWEQSTAYARRVALAADTEYRRRCPDTDLPPLVNAEPQPVSEDERAQLHTGARPEWLDVEAQRRAAAEAELASRASERVPDEDPDYAGTEAWPEQVRQRDAVWQPAAPQMPTAPALDREAGA